jgi:hypothetical protein
MDFNTEGSELPQGPGNVELRMQNRRRNFLRSLCRKGVPPYFFDRVEVRMQKRRMFRDAQTLLPMLVAVMQIRQVNVTVH